jgi:trans-2,3-dihydro-3-hydroxyanthranilate isomerase
MAELPFETVDVFTDRLFGGNPLAVVLDGRGLTTERMQAIAREFNYSETTFILPPDDPSHTARVRIFTPAVELPFAGHPNVGTAFVLARRGEIFGKRVGTPLLFEEKAGLVPVEVDRLGKGMLTAPRPLVIGDTIAPELVAPCLGMSPGDIAIENHLPTVASVGLGFLMVEINNRQAFERARIVPQAFAENIPLDFAAGVLFYLHAEESDEVDVRARMFSPIDGVGEDPATGSANAALVGLLAALDPLEEMTLEIHIAQGVEMGRPSLLEATAIKESNRVAEVRIGGYSVPVMSGHFHVPT